MKKILFLIAFLTTTFTSFADKKTIIVVDEKTKEELIGVTVTVDDTKYYTDFDGILVVDIANDSVNIKIEYPSYETKTIKLTDSQVIEIKSK